MSVPRFADDDAPEFLTEAPSGAVDTCVECWYCGAALAPRHEHDHAIPQRCGGTVMVAVCMNCHDLKDRTPLLRWDSGVLLRALREIPQQGHARLLYAKVLGTMLDLEPRLPTPVQAVPEPTDRQIKAARKALDSGKSTVAELAQAMGVGAGAVVRALESGA